MTSEVVLGTPLADSLQTSVQQKLAEAGWSTGGLDDSALAEYILLMLVNGKTQDQIASELSNELLGLAPDDTGGAEFTSWLFNQVAVLYGHTVPEQSTTTMVAPINTAEANRGNATTQPAQDTTMDDAMDTQQDSIIPTGPKSMRGGAQNARDKRVLGHVNKHLNDAALHKIKGSAGTGRITSHRGGPPTGPRGQATRGGHMSQARPPRGLGAAQQPQRPNMGAMAGAGAGAGGLGAMTPQQQMQLMAMYEEQARMMAQILSPQQQQMFPGQMAFGGPNAPQPQQGKSLFERVDTPNGRNGQYNKRNNNTNFSKHINPEGMTGAADPASFDPTSSMEVESSQPTKDPSSTICHYNLSCTRADCSFVHQSPAAPIGTSIDMTDTCSYGAACKNRKCVGKHPSPAKIGAFKAQADCKFYPNCTNPACPFKHPSAAPCRNGADCTVPNCTFAHSKVVCKFDPCLNPSCAFKHADGQKRGTFQDKVWKGGEHVSDRKFVDEAGAEEDLILPGGETSQQSADGVTASGEGIIA